ncbi:16S rRNA (uracil(1498)-N(3))-methyltransferase [Mycoplasma sp. Ms02]|uniref:16S rRNA (uracil(1498)-N(3))-methyltransferase n=1 Tax=Mycoplasma sp. Ms02 TaxID=353851 RepID=UPI001C8A4366|nr:16S rRNA (uracil(1498)-N(3))-methyltransferase [Mycoplasma sp. Ms02]QZE12058.1 16S rRNA (uracil(1498)-N(3))-methyltransferase [Mycoplasma sp. Ms02]
MNRFFAQKMIENQLFFDSKTHKHFDVLRLVNKTFIAVFEGKFYECKLDSNYIGIIEREIEENHEFDSQVILAAAMIKIDRWEWMLEKAVELGVTKIIPVISEHVDGTLAKFKYYKKVDRFKEIIHSAAKQSFRNVIPVLEEPQKIETVLNTEIEVKIIAHEKVTKNENNPYQIPGDKILLVGPEGGFSEKEVNLAISKGFFPVSLGKRILRAETASMYMLAQIK